MSHTVDVKLIGDSQLNHDGRLIPIHEIGSVIVDGNMNITSVTGTKESRAAAMILEYGMIDGAHHKQWLLDQVLKILLNERYGEVIEEYNSDSEYANWDEGIAP